MVFEQYMKIALCLSGQPRYIDQGYLQIKNNILSKYDVDCFVHTWWDNSMRNQKMVLNPKTSYGRQYLWDENTIEKIVEYYSPKIMMHQQQINFNLFEHIEYKVIPQYVHSMFYSIMMCNSFKKSYEKMNNFLYDFVIRCRFDVNFFKFDLDFNSLDSNKLHAIKVRPYLIGDMFSISSSQIMDKYSDAYNYLEKYSFDKNFNHRDESKEFVGESIISHHIFENNIDIFSINDKVQLNCIIA